MAPPESNTVFAQAVIDISAGQTMQHWLEQVADSSRYYVLKIQSSEGREATIGFGFRDREQGTDLRECLQHYEKSIRREKQAETATATGASTFSVPVLKEGEIIHVDRSSGKTSIATKKKSARGGVPMLLKKPPPPSPEGREKKIVPAAPAVAAAETTPKVAATATTSEKDVKEMTAVIGDIDLDPDKVVTDGAEDKDEVRFATDFDTK
jgi:hypothetical protein